MVQAVLLCRQTLAALHDSAGLIRDQLQNIFHFMIKTYEQTLGNQQQNINYAH